MLIAIIHWYINSSQAIKRYSGMPPLTMWKGVNVKTNDYKFFDRQVSEMFRIGGTEFWIHKYLGPKEQPASGDATQPEIKTDDVMAIQDMLNMEIRDRKYDQGVYSLKGHYQVSDTEFDLRQFGLFLSNDTIFITFHLNDMVNSIGRTLMSGDVIEILHRRDDLVMGQEGYGVSKYYVVQEGTRPSEGYSPTWWAHMWRIKCTPMTDGQEFNDILNKPALDINGDPIKRPNGGNNTLKDLISTYHDEIAINNAIVEQAEAEVPFRNLQGQQLYVLAGDLDDPVTIWAGDGIPPNHSKPVDNGITFPANPLVGDYFLRTDYIPNMLFRREPSAVNGLGKWVRIEINWRAPWQPANRILTSFINNKDTETTLQDGSVIPERQDLRKAIKAKLDPDIV
jgi:hypothetical protein